MRRWWWPALLLSACSAPGSDAAPAMSFDVDGEVVPSGWRAPSGPCLLDPPSPTGLLLTTTDFNTGALTVVDLDRGTVESDVAEGSTDAIPFAHGDFAFVLHRYQYDRLDVLRRNDWRLVGQHGVGSPAGSTNAHGIAVGPDGLAYVTTFGEPTLRVLDLSRPPAEAELRRIDLSGPADDDGNPEASLVVTCGDLVLVTGQRLDSSFLPSAPEVLIAVDPVAATAVDLEPDTPEADGLPLMGEWVRQLRRDPADPDDLTLLALSRGIERIDLATGRREWAVAPQAFAESGIDGRLQPQAFDVDDDGQRAYLAAYDADFSQVRLYQVGLDGTEPAIPEPFAEGFDSVERTLELVGDQLWYGSTRAEAPGLWRFDASPEMPTVVDGPLPTGLPPYSMVTLP